RPKEKAAPLSSSDNPTNLPIPVSSFQHQYRIPFHLINQHVHTKASARSGSAAARGFFSL
ncbi:MAG: hypothetical protein IJI53_07670, partial [Clostridia bacterium]|nr:hypothetical protein [Clostridia bacterium]